MVKSITPLEDLYVLINCLGAGLLLDSSGIHQISAHKSSNALVLYWFLLLPHKISGVL